jgi:cobalt/nickel transport system permease protein
MRRDSPGLPGYAAPGALSGLNTLEMCAGRNTVIHRLHPSVKMAATAIYVAVVISWGRYDVAALMPYFFYPAILTPLSRTPPRLLLGRLLPALPFALFGGVANLFFDTEQISSIGGIAITAGAVSFVSIMAKTVLSVSAILLLVSTTGMSDLSRQLALVGAPGVFTLQLVMTYRYLGVLAEEAGAMYASYILRSRGAYGIRIGDTGAFVGSLLLRSVDRAERVYGAMKCRGFSGAYPSAPIGKPGAPDILVFVVFCAAVIIPRCLN